jgi:hypothetical protein
MATDMHAFLGTRISGAPLAVLTVARSWKPRGAQFAPSTTDNSRGVSARWHRRT